jgi:hypothetical protein
MAILVEQPNSKAAFGGNRNSGGIGGIRRILEKFGGIQVKCRNLQEPVQNSCKHAHKPEFSYPCQKEVPVKKFRRKKKNQKES